MSTRRSRAGRSPQAAPESPPEEEKRPQHPVNHFQNDGSFMEMFRKQMEEQNKVAQAAANPTKPAEQKLNTGGGGPTSSKKEPEAEATYYSTQTMYYKDGDSGNSSSKKPQYQGIIGKRKTLMKTNELREKRKKRREELEEKQNAEQKEQKSSAWKSYMAEVKAYEERRCGDSDDHKRPLVK